MKSLTFTSKFEWSHKLHCSDSWKKKKLVCKHMFKLIVGSIYTVKPTWSPSHVQTKYKENTRKPSPRPQLTHLELPGRWGHLSVSSPGIGEDSKFVRLARREIADDGLERRANVYVGVVRLCEVLVSLPNLNLWMKSSSIMIVISDLMKCNVFVSSSYHQIWCFHKNN